MQTATRTAPDFAAARRSMIDSQLRTSGVNEAFVLDRMGTVPREDFVPSAARSVAYMDRAVPLGEGRFLASPLVHGRLLAEARPSADDRVLLVDGGAGYLAELVRPLIGGIEVASPEDAATGKSRSGDFTLLLIEGAVQEIPASLTRRLGPEGRVVTGLVRDGVTRLAVGRKSGVDVALLPLAEIGMPVLHVFDRPAGWSF